MKISGIILTKDGNVEKTKRSLNFCNEIIVVKNQKIIDFGQARNEALKKAKNDWVLFLDDDEVVPPSLRDEISNFQHLTSNLRGFYIKRKDFMWGKELKYGETGNTKLLRFARKFAGVWRRAVHEYWDIRGEVGEFKNPIYHNPHSTLKEFIQNVDYFSTLHAKENFKDGKGASLLKIIFWPRLKLVNNWILKLGFLDGTAGFVHALIMSFHSYLAWSKQWLQQRKSR